MGKQLIRKEEPTKKRHTGGRSLKLDIDTFRAETKAYLAEYVAENKLPTLTGLALRLGINDDSMSQIYGKREPYLSEIKRVKQIGTDWIISKLSSTEKPLVNHIFLAKAIAGLRDNSNIDITSDGKPLGVVILPKRGK